MVFDSIVIEGAIIVDDSRGSVGILLRDKEGTGSVQTLRRTDSTGDKHFFKEIDEGIEAIVWDSVVATINVFVRILETYTVPRGVWVGFDVPQLLNEDVSILLVDFRSDST